MREVALYIPKGARNRRVLLAASETLVRQITIPSADGFDPRVGTDCNKIDSEKLFEATLREGSISVALVVTPGDLHALAATIQRIHDSRGPRQPTARFIVLDADNFPAGKRPLHTRIFALDRTEDARAAIKLALEAADEEERQALARSRDELRDQIARI